MVFEEQRVIEPPPKTISIVHPWMTGQVEACNDFAPPIADSHLCITKTENRPTTICEEIE